MEKDNVTSFELTRKFNDGALPSNQEEKSSFNKRKGSSSHNQSPGADGRHLQPPTKVCNLLPYIIAVVSMVQ